MTTAILPDLLPTDEEVAFYQEHGYYHSRRIFTDAEIDAALEGSDRFYRGELDPTTVPVPDVCKPTGDYGNSLRKHDYASLQNRELTALVRHPLIGAIAARLSGSPTIRLWHDQLLYKPGDSAMTSNVGWHTDRGYWKTCTSPNMLTAWIPFHDCDEEQGTIMMIDGSHTWPDNTSGLDFFSGDLAGLEAKFQTGGKPVVKTPMNLKRGEVSFHHCLTIHGSGPNRTDKPRRSIAVHLQDDSNRYQKNYKPDGSLYWHYNDKVCRLIDGQPDYADPTPFPTLYG